LPQRKARNPKTAGKAAVAEAVFDKSLRESTKIKDAQLQVVSDTAFQILLKNSTGPEPGTTSLSDISD